MIVLTRLLLLLLLLSFLPPPSTTTTTSTTTIATTDTSTSITRPTTTTTTTPHTPSLHHQHESVSNLTTLLCAPCTLAFPDTFGALAHNSTDAKVGEALDKLCDLIPLNSLKVECLLAVDDLMSVVEGTEGATYLDSKYSPVAICSILGMCSNECCQQPTQPEQIKLAFTGDPSTMSVSWITLSPTRSMVQWGDNYTHTAIGTSATYSEGGWLGNIHYALMTDLSPDTTYFYRVGDPTAHSLWRTGAWSYPTLWFKTLANATAHNETESDRPLMVVPVIGDMGATDASQGTVEHISAMRLRYEGGIPGTTPTVGYDFLIHIGDISYADMDQRLWDEFGRMVEPLSAFAPYMVIPGNHEDFYSFHPYLNRYFMPGEACGSNSTMYYSYNAGPVHFVGFNTEAVLQGLADLSPSSAQYKWLAADLREANTPASRANQPFIIVYGHRPLYCSNSDDHETCVTQSAVFRAQLEDLFNECGVSLVIQGHVHAYERTLPVYQGVLNASAPIYITNGAAGSKELVDADHNPDPPLWSAKHFNGFGYGVLTFHNRSTCTWTFYRSDVGSVVDEVVMRV